MLSRDEAAIQRLVDKAVELAVQAGLRLDDTEGVYLKEFERRGGKVDWPARAALFTEADVDQALEICDFVMGRIMRQKS